MKLQSKLDLMVFKINYNIDRHWVFANINQKQTIGNSSGTKISIYPDNIIYFREILIFLVVRTLHKYHSSKPNIKSNTTFLFCISHDFKLKTEIILGCKINTGNLVQ